MFVYDSIQEQEAIGVVYDYCKLSLLTKPECSFINGDTYLGESVTYSEEHKKMPASLSNFKKDLQKIKWEVILCVAGTDMEDRRRAVVSYSKELKKLVVNFPMSETRFTPNEKKIKDWIDKKIMLLK